jgi:hypothetical protein
MVLRSMGSGTDRRMISGRDPRVWNVTKRHCCRYGGARRPDPNGEPLYEARQRGERHLLVQQMQCCSLHSHYALKLPRFVCSNL